MQNKKEKNSADKEIKSIISIRMLCRSIKKFFIIWLIAAVAVAAIIGGLSISDRISNRQISVLVNFSFDGVESGHDPSGNKFNINDLKSKNAIKRSLSELSLEYEDINEIYSSISISGNVPSNAISRITDYAPMYTSGDVNTSKKILDATYYPTQYTIIMDCSMVDMKFDECVNFLNTLTERYKQTFFEDYGYKQSLEDVVTAIDYNNYDYVDAVSVFDTSLLSIQDYIDELANKDETRFRSEKTGYTFTDLSKSIEVIRSDDLDMISSYITVNNVTKNKENLIANYQFKSKELERSKKIYEEKLASLSETIENYEKNSILIFANAQSGSDATLNQSSDTYDNLISQKVDVEKRLSNCQQQMDKYNNRIKALGNNSKKGSEEIVKEDFDKINKKINDLLSSVNISVTEYYETVALKNSYTILSEASGSLLGIILKALSDVSTSIIAIEFIVAGLYLTLCLITANRRINDLVTEAMNKFKRKNKKAKKEKNKR